jgi:ABC-type microcin C transport system permease subunit YejE
MNMRFLKWWVFAVPLCLIIISSATYAKNESAAKAKRTDTLYIDVRGKQLTPKVFKKSAKRAFSYNTWLVDTVEENLVRARVIKSGVSFWAEARYDLEFVTISYTGEHRPDSPGWLIHVRRTFLGMIEIE